MGLRRGIGNRLAVPSARFVALPVSWVMGPTFIAARGNAQQDQKIQVLHLSLRNQAAVTQMSRKMWQSAVIFETKEKKSGESGLL
jgi:hypothetical protein